MSLVKILAIIGIAPIIVSGAGPQPAHFDDNLHNTSASENSDFPSDVMCGPNCLWQVSRAFGKSSSLGSIAYWAGTTPEKGTTVMGMLEAAKKIGLPAEALNTNLKDLSEDPRIAILLLQLEKASHYVILDKIDNEKVRLLDGDKFKHLSIEQLNSIWKGYAIVIGEDNCSTEHSLLTYAAIGILMSGAVILLLASMYALKCIYSYLSKQH